MMKLRVGALYKNVGRVRMGAHPKMWHWATTLGKSAQAVYSLSLIRYSPNVSLRVGCSAMFCKAETMITPVQ